MRRLARLALLLVSLVALAAPACADDLTGKLLVATPDLDDPNFEHTVVLIVKHDKNGAFGLVVNDQVDERPLAELMRDIGLDADGATGTLRIFAGGPMERGRGFVLHSTDYARPETVPIGSHVAMTTSSAIFRDMAAGKGPAKALLVFGYAGWAPGQLEGEIAAHGWFTAPVDPKLVFDEPSQLRWQDAMRHRLREL